MSRVRNRLPVLIAGTVVVAALLVSLFGEVGILSTWRMDRNRKQVTEVNAGLREDIGRLRAEVDRLRTNSAYIEEIARKELGLIGRQENVIVLDRNRNVPPRDPPSGGTKRR
jgi:cell division protein FtsB